MLNTIIVIVPHSLCNTNKLDRDCDLIAGISASTLVNRLGKEFPNSEIIELQSNVHRSVIDLNRHVSRQTFFRENLTNLLKEKKVKFSHKHL